MQDAMQELESAGYVTGRHVEATRTARELNNSKNIAVYITEQRALDRAEATAAYGAGETIVNVITGEQFVT